MSKRFKFDKDGFEVRSFLKRKWIDYSKIESIKIMHRNMVTYDAIFLDIEACGEHAQLSELDHDLRNVIETIEASGIVFRDFPDDILQQYREGYEANIL